MKEYEKLNYMDISETDLDLIHISRICYLPHRAVYCWQCYNKDMIAFYAFRTAAKITSLNSSLVVDHVLQRNSCFDIFVCTDKIKRGWKIAF